jgi:hypothetical protein
LLEGVKAVTELVQFVGYFLAIGAVGFMELTFAALVLIVTSVLVTLPSPK